MRRFGRCSKSGTGSAPARGGTIKAASGGGVDYLHGYDSSRRYVDWNTCGQAAVATILDYHGLDPYSLPRPIYDEKDGRYHWDDGEIIDSIKEDFPPDNVLGVFGTSGSQIAKALEASGLEAVTRASRDVGEGQRIWEEVKRFVAARFPIIVIMDSRKLGGRPFAAHWGVVYRVAGGIVYLANTKNVTAVPEAQFLRAFRCRFMLPSFNHCAVFSLARTVANYIQ